MSKMRIVLTNAKPNAVCQNQWISLTNPNQYLYFCCGQCQLRIICKDQVTAHQLTGSNIINIAEGCLVKTDNSTIYSHYTPESKMEISYKVTAPEIAPINHVVNITLDEITIENSTLKSNEELIKELGQRIQTMKADEALVDNISVHDVHHYSLIYSLWGVVIIVAVLFACRRVRARREAAAAVSSSAAEEGPADGPKPVARAYYVNSANSEQCSARVQIGQCDESVNSERVYKDRGTTPVLRKIAFSDKDI